MEFLSERSPSNKDKHSKSPKNKKKHADKRVHSDEEPSKSGKKRVQADNAEIAEVHSRPIDPSKNKKNASKKNISKNKTRGVHSSASSEWSGTASSSGDSSFGSDSEQPHSDLEENVERKERSQKGGRIIVRLRNTCRRRGMLESQMCWNHGL